MIIRVLRILLESIFEALCDNWKYVSSYVAGVLTVVLIAIACDKPRPQPSTQTVTKYDTIRTIDTITARVPVSHVVRVVVRDTMILHDTTDGEPIIDTLGCLSGEYVAADSASFQWSACSPDFPIVKIAPIDWNVKYLPAPKIEKTVTITDTIFPTTGIWSRIKNNSTWCAIGTVIGAGATMYFMSR